MEWELDIIEWLQSSLGSTGRVLGNVFSFIGGGAGLMILLTAVLFCWKKETGQKLVLITVSLHAWFSMIKALVMRPRPYMEHPDRVEAQALVDTYSSAEDIAAQGYSFPSMHSGAAAASYFSLAREVKRKWFRAIAAALTLLVGLSRITTGNHYPTDVLAGWVLGFVVMGIFELLGRHVQKEWVRHLILLDVTLPGLLFVRTKDYFTSLGLLIGAIAAIPFERKYVNYQDTRSIRAMILRMTGAIAVLYGLNTLLKLPFAGAFSDSSCFSALLIRSGRYAADTFCIMGIYPKVFPLFEKTGKSG